MTTPIQQLEILLSKIATEERQAYRNKEDWAIRADMCTVHRCAIESALDKCRKEEPK